MTLREKIELCIRAETDPAKAAILVMGMVEMHGPEVSERWVENDVVLAGADSRWLTFNAACDQATRILDNELVEF